MNKDIDNIKGKGVYCLVLRNTACSIDVGSLGKVDFRSGYHFYVGSDLGQGGFKRLKRHVRVSRSKKVSRLHWHIDYLLTSPSFELVSVIYAATPLRLECLLAGGIGGESIPGFGCSDCSCKSHLFYCSSWPETEVMEAFSGCCLQAFLMQLSENE